MVFRLLHGYIKVMLSLYTLPCAHDFVSLGSVYLDVVMDLHIVAPVRDDVASRFAQVPVQFSYTIQDHMDGMDTVN